MFNKNSLDKVSQKVKAVNDCGGLVISLSCSVAFKAIFDVGSGHAYIHIWFFSHVLLVTACMGK